MPNKRATGKTTAPATSPVEVKSDVAVRPGAMAAAAAEVDTAAVAKPVAPAKAAKPESARVASAKAKAIKSAPPAAADTVAAVTDTSPAASETPERATKKKKSAHQKPELVRDSFTMPGSDYELLAQMKARLLSVGTEAKKSEVLRAALRELAALDDKQLVAALGKVERIKTGRPSR